MTLYNIKEKQEEIAALPQEEKLVYSKRDRLFSTTAARLFFLLLLVADILWAIYSLGVFVIVCVAHMLTFFKYCDAINSAWRSLKRSLVCGIALFIALFSPSLGIMIACTYFLMYDQSGIEEVVPASLREQFKEFTP